MPPETDMTNPFLSGYSLVVLPGGEQEMILAKPGDHSIVLKNRMGFVRLAIQRFVRSRLLAHELCLLKLVQWCITGSGLRLWRKRFLYTN